MSHSIQIYNGTGASNSNVNAWKREFNDLADLKNYKIDEFNQSYTAGFERGNVAMVLIPGGNTLQMKEEISSLAFKINHAINLKASYLGSCAGAMVCCDKITTPSCKFKLDVFSTLKLNPLETSALFYMPKSTLTSDGENMATVAVDWLTSTTHEKAETCTLFHAFGPSFPMKNISSELKNKCHVLANYKTNGNIAKDQEPAATVIYKPEGASPRLFTGIHPEFSATDILSDAFSKYFNESNCFHQENLAMTLEGEEKIRKEMCRSWFSELGILTR